MMRNFSLTVIAVALLAGCASATKRYEQGAQLQREGRSAEAAERYIQALKKDSRLDSARAGLRTAGAEAIAQYMRVAADPATQAPAAADQFLAVDDLQRRALEVGIFLPEPAGYAGLKRAAFDRAIARAVSDAPLLINAGQYSQALGRLQRAATAYQPTATQVSSIAVSGSDVMLAWAKADTAEGRFRAAYGRVERMGEQPGATQRQLDEARSIMTASLARGTRRIAVAPPWATVAARNELPEDALLSLADAMNDDPWISPPQWVAIFPVDQVEREIRRQGLARRTMTANEAARIARTLGADFAVVTEVDSVRREDVDVHLTRRPARTRGGIDTAYFIEEGRTRLYARVTYAVIGRDGTRGSDYQSVETSVTSPFMRVRYAGDYRGLDLRQSERELFERSRTEGDVVRTLVNALSPRLAEDVFTEVVRRVP